MTPATAGPAVQLRPVELGDVALVMSSWLSSYRDGPVGRLITDSVFYSETRPIVQALVSRCPPVVACDPANPDSIYGWACGERVGGALVVHFVYVRQPWRGWGIARQLVAALGYQPGEKLYATHVTSIYRTPRFRRSSLGRVVVNNPWLGIRRAAGV